MRGLYISRFSKVMACWNTLDAKFLSSDEIQPLIHLSVTEKDPSK